MVERTMRAKPARLARSGEMAGDNETVGDALTRAGFEPAKVGRKIVSQGKRRESLKRWAAKEPDK